MGFHRRHISNDQVIEIYEKNGMLKVYEWYTNGADALVTEHGIASQIQDRIIGKRWSWSEVSELIDKEILRKELISK